MEIIDKYKGSSNGVNVPVRNKRPAFNRAKLNIIDSEVDLLKQYPDSLNFYMTPPCYSISLQEFDQYAVERMRMLRLIERVNVKHETRNKNEYFQEIKNEMRPLVEKNELTTYDALFANPHKYDKDEQLQARKIDHISHFLLRLAYARTEELRRWFVSIELDLFRIKMLFGRTSSNFNPILEKYNLPYVDAGEEATKYYQEIGNSTFSLEKGSHVQIYKVHFLHALDLVKSRHVFLRDGYAFVPYNELATVICLKFRSYLSESLSMLKKNIHLIDDDERLRPIVSSFEKRYVGSDGSTIKAGDAVTVAQLSTFSQKSFPLCMKHLYDVVQKEYHLKHWGRLQLGLFFKGLGVPIDEATKFWRNNFTKRPEIDSSRFDKQYLYNIRHMYGQEGKRADYTPYSCMKVINSSVGPGDHHGCPFRHSDATPLRVKLVEAGVNQDGIKEIVNLVEQKHFQIACQRYFELTHDHNTIEGGVNHPNQYFIESRNVLTGKKTLIKSEKKVETTPTLMYKNGDRSTQSQPEDQPTESMDIDITHPVDMMNEDDSCDAIFKEMEY